MEDKRVENATRHRRPNAGRIAAPIYYDDGTAIHACESCLMYPGDRPGVDAVRPGRAGQSGLHR